MIIKTSNPEIKLKKFSPEDSPVIFNLINENRKHLSQSYSSGKKDKTSEKYPNLESVLESIKNPSNPNKLRFGIWHNEKYVGSINLTPEGDKAEIGYYIGSKFINKGYATLATIALTDYALRTFDQLYAKVEFENNASARVLEKAGFIETTKKYSKKRFFINEKSSKFHPS